MTIPLSHYCERARWALDAAGVDYVEDQNLQMFAGKKTVRLGATKTVPVLVLDDDVLPDSADIVRWASSQADDLLYPRGVARDRVEALEARFAGDYGVETRRVVYDWFFRNLDPCLPYNACAAPRYQAWLLRVMKGPIVPRMVRYLGLSADEVDAGRDFIRREMDDVAERLADGRPFLMGDAFTAADLTFAAMTAVSILPARYGVAIPEVDTLDEAARRWIEEMREHPAGKFALRMYERRPPVRGKTLRPPAPV